MAIYPRSFFAAVLAFFTVAYHAVNAVPALWSRPTPTVILCRQV